MNRLVVLVLIAAVLWLLLNGEAEVRHPNGVLVAEEPSQIRVKNQPEITVEGYKLTPLADFKITARVLSREDYRFDREADLARTDLALGWGRMSDQAVVDEISISQSGRWYRWRTKTLPIPIQKIKTHSANMHIIPADAYTARQLEKIKVGHVVTISGSLVRADSDDGWKWVSSLRRDDQGAGACELIYAREIYIAE